MFEQNLDLFRYNDSTWVKTKTLYRKLQPRRKQIKISNLKAGYTFGNCLRPASSLGVPNIRIKMVHVWTSCAYIQILTASRVMVKLWLLRWSPERYIFPRRSRGKIERNGDHQGSHSFNHCTNKSSQYYFVL